MKRFVFFLIFTVIFSSAFSQIENTLKNANSLANACLSSDADIYAECLGEANEQFNAAYSELVANPKLRSKISDLDYARMMFHVGYSRYLTTNAAEAITFYDSAMNVYAKNDKLKTNDVWRCFEMLDVLKAYYNYNEIYYEKYLQYALINADFTKKYLKKQYFEYSIAMEEVSDAYFNLQDYENAEKAMDEAIKAEESANGKKTQRHDILEMQKENIESSKYSFYNNKHVDNTTIKYPKNRRDSLYNIVVNGLDDYSGYSFYYFENVFTIFDTLQWLFEKDGLKNPTDSLLYANTLHAMGKYSNFEYDGDISERQKNLMKARAAHYLKLADAMCASPQNVNTENHAYILYSLAVVYNNLYNDQETAMKYAGASLEIFTKLPSNYNNLEISMRILSSLDSYYKSIGDYDKAIRYNEIMADYSRNEYNYKTIIANIADGYMLKGDYDKAIEYYLQIEDSSDFYFSDSYFGIYTDGIVLKLIEAYEKAGKHEEAEKYRKKYEDMKAEYLNIGGGEFNDFINGNNEEEDTYGLVPMTYLNISDFMDIAVDDDEVQALYDATFLPTTGTHCDSLRYDVICFLFKSKNAPYTSDRINNVRPAMIDFQEYIASGKATATDSLYYAYSLYNVARYNSAKSSEYLTEAKTIFEALKLTETRNYANTLYEIAEYNYSMYENSLYDFQIDDENPYETPENPIAYQDESITYYNKAYNVYNKLPANKFYLGRCEKILGKMLDYYIQAYDKTQILGVYDKNLALVARATDVYDKSEIVSYKCNIYEGKAKIYYAFGEYTEAIDCYKKTLSELEKDKDLKESYKYCQTLRNIYTTYENIDDSKNVKKYRKQYEKMSKKFMQNDDMEEDDDEYYYRYMANSDNIYDMYEIYGQEPISRKYSLYQSLSSKVVKISMSGETNERNEDERNSVIETIGQLKNYFAANGYEEQIDSIIYVNSLLYGTYTETIYANYDSAFKYLDEIDGFIRHDNPKDEDYIPLHLSYIDLKIEIYKAKGDQLSLMRTYDELFDYYMTMDRKNLYGNLINGTGFDDFLYAADLCVSSHNYAKAFKYYNRLLALISEGSSYSYKLRYSMALAYYQMSDYASVIGCIEPEFAGKNCDSFSYDKDDFYVNVCNLLGNTYMALGNYEKSAEYFSKAQECERNWSYSDELTPSVANTLNNLGNLYRKMNKDKIALDIYKESLDIYKKNFGEDDINCAASYNNIGNVYYGMGKYDDALSMYEKSRSIMAAGNMENTNDYANTAANIAIAYSAKKEYAKALSYADEALSITEQIYGTDHARFAAMTNNKGDVLYASGEYQKAADCYTKALAINRKHVASDFSMLTATEREMYWEQNSSMCQRILRCGSKLPDSELISGGAYDAELITKGMLLSSEIGFTRTVYESGDSVLIGDYLKLASLNEELNKAYEMPVEERYIDTYELKERINTLERDLVSRAAKYGDIAGSAELTWKDVQSALQGGDVAIEFTKFEVDSTETRYAALVLTKNAKSPVLVPLCTAAELQRLMRTGNMPGKQSDDSRGASVLQDKRMGVYATTDLYNAIWKPIEKYFDKNARVYFAPTGVLHQVAIEYAPVDSKSTISDKYQIYRVSSTRFLSSKYPSDKITNAVLYGGISYDSDVESMKHENLRYGSRAVSYNSFAEINKDEDRSSLNYLPGTKTEVEAIAEMMKSSKWNADLREGEKANEESFKDLSGKKVSLLHIATHGFFMPTDEKLNSNQSLNLSGLMLAGANNIWQNRDIPEGVEDGILTAKEISGMDLRSTDMVVLSACQTGLGEITDEGVFGLQRGFKKAGVRTIIMLTTMLHS